MDHLIGLQPHRFKIESDVVHERQCFVIPCMNEETSLDVVQMSS